MCFFFQPWIKMPLSVNSNSENVVSCQVDTEVLGNSPAMNTNPVPFRKSTIEQNLAVQTRAPEADNSSDVDGQTFEYHHLHPVPSPYRKQTPLNSPVESPTRTQFWDETEVLLKPGPKNTTSSITYVTIDFFKASKPQTKWSVSCRALTTCVNVHLLHPKPIRISNGEVYYISVCLLIIFSFSSLPLCKMLGQPGSLHRGGHVLRWGRGLLNLTLDTNVQTSGFVRLAHSKGHH